MLTGFTDHERARAFAESYARVFETFCDEMIDQIRDGRETWKVFDMVRHKRDAMTREYFSRPFESTETAWEQCGVGPVFDKFYRAVFP